MRVLSFNFSHDASVSVIEDGELSFYSMEERISRKKHASFPFYSLLKAKKKYKNFDLFVINGLHCGSNDFATQYPFFDKSLIIVSSLVNPFTDLDVFMLIEG